MSKITLSEALATGRLSDFATQAEACDLKFLRIDCDFEAEGLWNERGAMVPVDSAPLSRPLRDRIRAWNAWYSEAAQPWSQHDTFDYALNRQTAVDIARWVVRELPDWAIVALDYRVTPSGQVSERVPYPGEDGGRPFAAWRAEWLADEQAEGDT